MLHGSSQGCNYSGYATAETMALLRLKLLTRIVIQLLAMEPKSPQMAAEWALEHRSCRRSSALAQTAILALLGCGREQYLSHLSLTFERPLSSASRPGISVEIGSHS